MVGERVCPKCGRVVPSDAPQGLCPACLMAFALVEGPDGSSTEGPRDPTRSIPPALARPGEAARGEPDRPTLHDEATLPPPGLGPREAPTDPRISLADAPTEPVMPTSGSIGMVRDFGDYELLREIARGGMGVVYRARQVSLNRPVALKMILAGKLAGEPEVRRFQMEAEAAANLDHPGIVPIFEIGEHDGRHYFSMGFVEGSSLAARVADGPLPPREAASLTTGVAEAVQYAHDRGVIHRDLKPANILIDGKGRPKVTDFGLAKKWQSDDGLTQTGQVMGTPSYMPPEQAEGKEVGPAADVYALGAILYCLLTGRPPFQAATAMDTLSQVVGRDPVSVRQLNPTVPRDLETIALKALQKEPRRRYESAHALGQDLGRWLRGEPISARPAGRAEKARKWASRNPVVASLSAVTTLAILVGVLGVVWQWRRAEANFEEAETQREIAETNYGEVKAQRRIAEANYEEAKAQRRIAEANYEEAKAQRRIAEAKTADVQAQARKLERQGYVSLIAISQRETQANNVALSDRLLERCPPHLRGWEWRHCARANHRELATIRAVGRNYKRLGVPSPDGRRLACSDGAESWVCDLDGREQFSMAGHSGEIASIAWSPDGKTIATGSQDREIRLWDAESGAGRGVLRGHGIWVMALCFSPDGLRLLSGAGAFPLIPGRRDEVKLWDLAHLGEIRTLLSGPGGGVKDVAFSPDGRRVAAGTSGGVAYVWDVESGRRIRQFVLSDLPPTHQGISGVRFGPDGRTLAAAGTGGVITLWDIESGSLVRSLQGHDGLVVAVRFTPDGRRLVSGGKDATIRFWDVETGGERVILRGHLEPVERLDFDPSGTRLYSSSSDGTTRIWDATLETYPPVITGHTGWTQTLAFHADGKTLATGGWGGTLIWDCASGRRLGRIDCVHPGGPTALAFRPDGKQLAAVGPGPRIPVWDHATGREVHSLEGHAGGSGAVVFSPDGSSLIVGDDGGDVRIWDLASASETKRFRAHDEKIVSVSLAADGRRLLTASPGDLVKVWDLVDGRELLAIKAARSYMGRTGTIAVFDHAGERLAILRENNSVAILDAREGWALRTLVGHSAGVNALAFSPDGRRFASGGSDQTVRVWDPDRGEEMLTLRGRVGDVTALAWSRDGQYLAAVGTIGGQVWDAGPPDGAAHDDEPEADSVGRYREFASGENCKDLKRIAYSPDGRTLALGCGSGEVRLWDTATNSVRAVLRGHTAPAVALAFSPDGAILATGSGDWKNSKAPGAIKLWDPRTGTFLADLEGHAGAIWTLAFSPDSRTLASGSSDGLVRLWDPSRHAVRTTLDSGTGLWVRGLAFTPDGKRLASSHMESVRLWNLETQKTIAQLQGHSEEINTLAISPDGTMLATAGRDKTAVLWDLASGEKRATFDDRRGWVCDVAFSPDGKSLAFCVLDGSVELRDIAGDRLRAAGRNPGGYASCVAFSPDGKTVASGQPDLVLWRFGE